MPWDHSGHCMKQQWEFWKTASMSPSCKHVLLGTYNMPGSMLNAKNTRWVRSIHYPFVCILLVKTDSLANNKSQILGGVIAIFIYSTHVTGTNLSFPELNSWAIQCLCLPETGVLKGSQPIDATCNMLEEERSEKASQRRWHLNSLEEWWMVYQIAGRRHGQMGYEKDREWALILAHRADNCSCIFEG